MLVLAVNWINFKRTQMTNIKNQPNRKIYIDIIKQMTAEERLMKTFELSQMVKSLFYESFKKKYAYLDPYTLNQKYLEYLEKCHNKNY
jgi:hypothetical protein